MNLSTFLALLAVFVISLSGQVTTQNAECDYEYHWFATSGFKPTNQTYYACYLNTKQIIFGENVGTIQGQHKDSHNDANVKFLRIFDGNKLKKFTSIFCHKFPNLEVIYIEDAGTELLDEDSLSGCGNLNYINFVNNEFRELPDNLLIGNSNLVKLYIQKSKLATLPENFFLNQKNLEELNLDKNQINFLPTSIFHPLVKLELLFLVNSKLQYLNPEWFVTLQNLRWLGFEDNQISVIPSKCFASLRNLEKLWLNKNRIKALNLDHFDGLQNLERLYLYGNEISDLPVGIFTQFRNLQHLDLSNNKLTTINSDSFGIHNQLTKIWLNDNKIDAIDEKFIDNTAVSFLNMINNICSQLPITSASEVKPNLQKCFDNYQPRRQTQFLVTKPDKFSPSAQTLTTSCGKQVIGQGNIVGGAHANRGGFPWNAALVKTNGQFFCGGSVVTNRKIITAAHCIQDKGVSTATLARDMLVLLGIYDLNNPYEAGRAISSVQSINMHPNWNPHIESFDADITVLVLASQVTFSVSIQPICLPDSNILDIKKGYVVGYGKSEDDTKVHENIPKIIETPIHSNEDCFFHEYTLVRLSSKRTFCGGTGNGTGVCNGDSGSGLIVFYEKTFFLRAVVSSSLRGGLHGCDVNTYSVFTDVTKYIDWIHSIPTSRFE